MEIRIFKSDLGFDEDEPIRDSILMERVDNGERLDICIVDYDMHMPGIHYDAELVDRELYVTLPGVYRGLTDELKMKFFRGIYSNTVLKNRFRPIAQSMSTAM